MNPYDHQINQSHEHTIFFETSYSFGAQEDPNLLMIEQAVQAVRERANIIRDLPETANNMISLQVIANNLRTIGDLLGLDNNICDLGLSEETISKHLHVSTKQGKTSGNCED